MSQLSKLKKSRKRRVMRVRSKIKSELPRVTVFRSNKQMYAQVIKDNESRTLTSCSSLELGDKVKGDKTAVAHAVGKELAARALKEGVSKVVFDRGIHLFHGRVKALADGLIEGGVTI